MFVLMVLIFGASAFTGYASHNVAKKMQKLEQTRKNSAAQPSRHSSNRAASNPKLQQAADVARGDFLDAAYEYGQAIRARSLLQLAAWITLVYWMYRSYRNLPALGASGLHTNRVGVVLWWLVPLANFYRPLMHMKDIYANSRVIGAPSPRTWWVLMWLSYLLVRGHTTMVEAETSAKMMEGSVLLTIGGVVLCVLAYQTWKIMQVVNDSQESMVTSSRLRKVAPERLQSHVDPCAQAGSPLQPNQPQQWRPSQAASAQPPAPRRPADGGPDFGPTIN